MHALRERGVEYIEVRCIDLDSFVPAGIAAPTLRLLDIFLLHCLLRDSPPDTPQAIAELGPNQHCAAAHGREPGLAQERNGRSVLVVGWAAEILTECAPIAAALDAARASTLYSQALAEAQQGVAAPETLPSARLLAHMQRDFGGSYSAFVGAQSETASNHLLALPSPEASQAMFESMARESQVEQAALEAADGPALEDYRQAYLSPERLKV